MTVTEVVLNPMGDTGYAIILQQPVKDQANNKVVLIDKVLVCTKNYVQKVLPVMNKTFNDKYVPPENMDSMAIATFTHNSLISSGYISKDPSFVEVVDEFYDIKEGETDPQKAIINRKKHYNLHMNGTLLIPPYPEVIPTFHLVIPRSPI